MIAEVAGEGIEDTDAAVGNTVAENMNDQVNNSDMVKVRNLVSSNTIKI